MNTLLTTTDVAKMLGYTPVHVRRLARQGAIPGQKIGRDWVFKPIGILRRNVNERR